MRARSTPSSPVTRWRPSYRALPPCSLARGSLGSSPCTSRQPVPPRHHRLGSSGSCVPSPPTGRPAHRSSPARTATSRSSIGSTGARFGARRRVLGESPGARLGRALPRRSPPHLWPHGRHGALFRRDGWEGRRSHAHHLAGRFNPAARADSGAGPAEPPADPRQRSLFAAGWTLGAVAGLTRAGADSVTLFETIGPRGVLGPLVDETSGWPRPGLVYPVWFVLADLADRSRMEPLALVPASGPAITGLAMHGPGRLRVLLANVTARPVRLTIGPISARSARVRILDARSIVAAVAAPRRSHAGGERRAVSDQRLALELGPFAYVRVDAGSADA